MRQMPQTKIIVLHYLYIATVLFTIKRAQLEFENDPHPTGTHLRGPVNQSVQLGKDVRFECRLQNRMRFGMMNPDWEKSVDSKQLYVQWIIDGFGVTNETLKSVHAERYHMPGPMNQGIYDLVISSVQLEDEAIFICQANVKLYRSAQNPIIETLTSQPVYLTVVVPPKGLVLRKSVHSTQFNQHPYFDADTDSVNRITIAWNNSTSHNYRKMHDSNYNALWVGQAGSNRTVADDPTMMDTARLVDDASKSEQRSGVNHTVTWNAGSTGAHFTQPNKHKIPVVWVKEKEQLILECQTSPSKPVSQIAWVLAGSYLRPADKFDRILSPPAPIWQASVPGESIFTAQDAVQQSEQFEIENQELNVSAVNFDQGLNFGNQTDEVMKITVSVLRLTVRRHHQRQILQCRIANTDDFMVQELPMVSAIIEPLYVDKIRIEPMDKAEHEELREGTNVEYHCTANTNPGNPFYRWVLIRDGSGHGGLTGNHTYNVDPTTVMRPMPVSSTSSDPSIVRLHLHRDMHRSRIVCWVGVRIPGSSKSPNPATETFFQPGQLDEQMTWRKTERELNILYGAVFEHVSDNLRATKLGQVITLDCSVDANPTAQISLYRLGEAGRRMLNRLSSLHTGLNQSFGVTGARASSKPSLLLRNELSPSELASAVKTKGSQVLASATQKLSYPLQLQRMEDFGFYICVARNSGFPPALRHVLVGETGPPKIVQCRQVQGRNRLSVELVCLIHSIPRPTSNQIVWTRRGVTLKSGDRLHIYQEQLIRGTRSALHFRKLLSEDISDYNFTVYNDYGADWQIVSVSNEASLPLVFVIGSGAATGLAIIFVVIIGCFIRHTRTRSTQSVEAKKSVSEASARTNGLDQNSKLSNQRKGFDMELNLLAQSPTSPSTVSNEQQKSCHLCLTAQNPAFLDTKMEVDDTLGGSTSVNCKKSDDSGCELGDVMSVSAGPTEHGYRDHVTTVTREFQPLVGTMFVRNPSVVCYPTSTAHYDTNLNTSKYGNTFVNVHAGSCCNGPPEMICAQQQQQQQQQQQLGQQQSQHPQYVSHYNSLTCPRPVITKPLSPILFVSPTIPQTSLYENPTHSAGLLIPQVLFSSNRLVTSPVKEACFTPPTAQSPQPLPVTGNSNTLSTTAPDIYPDMSVLPLNFTDQTPGFAPSTTFSSAVPVSSVGHYAANNTAVDIRFTAQPATVLAYRNSDDDGTTV